MTEQIDCMSKAMHDFRENKLRWGRNIFKKTWKILKQKKEGFYCIGDEFEIIGVGYGLNKGDMLLFELKAGDCAFIIRNVEYQSDPPDLWKARLSYCGEVEEEI